MRIVDPAYGGVYFLHPFIRVAQATRYSGQKIKNRPLTCLLAGAGRFFFVRQEIDYGQTVPAPFVTVSLPDAPLLSTQ